MPSSDGPSNENRIIPLRPASAERAARNGAEPGAKQKPAPKPGGRPTPRAEAAPVAPNPVDLERLRQVVLALMPGIGRDLTLRQLAALLLIYDGGEPRTACALADALAIPRPAMTRALDRLGALDLARRETDPTCRRNVLVRPTARGRSFLSALRRRLTEEAA